MAPRRPAAPRARARRALRLQPDHGPPRAGRAGPRAAPRADARPGHVRHPPPHRPRPRRLDDVHRGDAAPRPRPGDPRHHRADRRRRRRRRRGPGHRARRPGGPPRAAPAGRRRAAAARAGLPARRAGSRACSPATSRAARSTSCSARATTRASPGRASRSSPSLLRSGRRSCSASSRTSRRCSSRAWPTTTGRPVEFARTFVRGDRTRYYVERVVVSSSRPIRRHRCRRRGRRDRGGPPTTQAPTTGSADGRRPDVRRRSRCEPPEPSPPSPPWRCVATAVRRQHDGAAPASSSGRRHPSRAGGGAVDRAQRRAGTDDGGRRRSRPASSIRWYCCLGAGDAPEQVEVEKKVVDDFNAAHPDIQSRSRSCLRGSAPTTRWRPRSQAGNPPGHRRPGRHRRRQRLRRPVARPRAADREDRLRPVSEFPQSAVDYLQGRRRPGGHPVRDLPVRAVLPSAARSRRPASTSRRTSTASNVHDARRLRQVDVGLRHGPRSRRSC